MLEIPVYNTSGEQTDTLKIEDDVFGREVNVSLLKQAVVAYHANKRQGSASTKSRGLVDGSTRKLFRQKGTGNARRGAIRTVVQKGGGVAFAKRNINFKKKLPQKMRKAALASAILAKILGNDIKIVDGLKIEAPKTAEMASLMKNLEINRSCLLAIDESNSNIYLSSRNIADLTVRATADLNAFDVATRQKMLVTSEAMKALVAQEDQA